MSKHLIEAFLLQMRERHAEEIDAVTLPDGAAEYLRERMAEGDAETLEFMMKLGWLMGVQTGFAAGQAAAAGDDGGAGPRRPTGPLQA